jgi:hypothetical protein
MTFQLRNTLDLANEADCETYLRSYHTACGDHIAAISIGAINDHESGLPYRIALVRLMCAARPLSWELWMEPGLGLYGEC